MLNPPSGVTAANYWAAIKAGKPTHVRITFLGQDIVLTDEDIDFSTGITINDVLNSDTDLVFGKAICKQVSMQILNSSTLTGLVWTGEFTLEFGVEMGTPAVTKWVTVGTFSGDKPKNVTTAQTIAFDAYDRMKKFDILADDFVKGITYPATLSTIYSNLCAFVGVSKVAGNELANIMNRSFASAPAEMEGYTCRDLLAWIAEAAGCYAKINAAGNVQMVWFADNTSHSVSADEEFSVETGDIHAGMTWDEADAYTWDEIGAMTWNDVCGYAEAYSIDQIQVKQLGNDFDIDYPYPYGGNVYMIVENPFLSISTESDITNYVKPIYDRLAAFGGYLPVSINCVGSWCVEAGDVITISVQGNSITFPIFVKTMRWNGAIVDEYEATGNSTRSAYANDGTKQRVLENHKIALYVGEAKEEIEGDIANNYYKIRSGIEIVDEGVTISGSKYLKLESGGILDVTSPNFELKSGLRYIRFTDWYVDDDGLHQEESDSTFGKKIIGFGNWTLNHTSPYPMLTVAGNINRQSGNNNTIQTFGITFRESSGYAQRIIFRNNVSNTRVNVFACEYTTNDDTNFIKGILGDDSSGGRWDINGDVIRYNTLVQNSSRDIKHDIKALPSMGDKLDQLAPVTFVYDNDEKEQQRMGLIYEDTLEVMPEICTGDEDSKAINYVELIPALLKEIQELRARVAELERRN